MLPWPSKRRFNRVQVGERFPRVSRTQMAVCQTATKSCRFGPQRVPLGARLLVGTLVGDDPGELTPDIPVIRFLPAEGGGGLQIQPGITHQVNGGINPRRAVGLMTVKAEGDEVLDVLPDVGWEMAGVDSQHERTRRVDEVFVDARDDRVRGQGHRPGVSTRADSGSMRRGNQ